MLGGASSPAGESSGAGLQGKAQDMAAAMRVKAAGAAEGLAGRQERQDAAPPQPSRGMQTCVLPGDLLEDTQGDADFECSKSAVH